MSVFGAALLLAIAAPAFAQNAGGRPIHNEAERLAKWKTVEMPFRPTGLSARERQMVDKLVEACRLLDDVFWRQSDIGGLALYKTTRNQTLKDLLGIMGGRWDLVDENHFFVGKVPYPPGHELFPHNLTRARLDQYLQQHPEDKSAIYDPYTVVRWKGDRLVTVPYREEYKQLLQPMAKALRDAAALSPDPAFAKFLRLRADALLSDDYYASDVAWLDLKDPKFDVIFAPYETYLDELLGVKTSYGASVLVRNDQESRKLAAYQQYIPEIQEALPIDAAYKPSKRGHVAPMEVMDAPYRAGDLRHGYQAVADNLPNDPRLHQEKGSKQIFFNNFLFCRTNAIIIPLVKRLMPADQASKVTADGYMAGTVCMRSPTILDLRIPDRMEEPLISVKASVLHTPVWKRRRLMSLACSVSSGWWITMRFQRNGWKSITHLTLVTSFGPSVLEPAKPTDGPN